MPTDHWNEDLARRAIEDLLEQLRPNPHFQGVANRLRAAIETILTLREADPVHPSAKPFKCPHCGSHCFGPTWRGKELAGRYCKGWPSDEDRSYRQCPAKYVEWYGQADQRGAQQVSTDPLNATADPQSALHHPSRQEGAAMTPYSRGYAAGLKAAAEACRKTGAQGDPVKHYACHDCADNILSLPVVGEATNPGWQPVAWTTVLSLELAKGAFYASPVNLWAEKGIPIYTHPGGQTLAAKEGNTSEGPREATPTSASLGLLAAAEEERNET